jgi:hypothetical protein
MAGNSKISNLDPAAGLTGTEEIPVVQAGETVKATAQAIADLAPSENLGNTDLIANANERKFILNGDSSSNKFIVENGTGVDVAQFKGDGHVYLPSSLSVGYTLPLGRITCLNGSGIGFYGIGSSGEQTMFLESTSQDKSLPLNIFSRVSNGSVGTNIGAQIAMDSGALADAVGLNVTTVITGVSNTAVKLNASGATTNTAIEIINGNIKTPANCERLFTGAGTHTTKLGGGLVTDRHDFKNLSGTTFTSFHGNGDANFYDSSSVNYAQFDEDNQTFNATRLNVQGIGDAKEYAFNVYSRLGNSSGISKFYNNTLQAVFDFRQSVGNGTLGINDSSGVNKIFFHGGTGKITSDLLEVQPTDAGASNKAVHIVSSIGTHMFKVMNDGKIGINTASDPTAQLDITTQGSLPVIKARNTSTITDATIQIEHTQASKSAELSLQSDEGELMSIRANGSNTVTFQGRPVVEYAEDLAFNVGATEKVTITKNGDVQTHDSGFGFVVRDRSNGRDYRLYTDNGVIEVEEVV